MTPEELITYLKDLEEADGLLMISEASIDTALEINSEHPEHLKKQKFDLMFQRAKINHHKEVAEKLRLEHAKQELPKGPSI